MSECSSSGSCTGNCASCGQSQEALKLAAALGQIKRKIVVMSGKGGVGKSTVAANLACTLARSGRKVGLLDVDVHGPSIPKMLGVEDARPEVDENEKIIPAEANGVKIISMGFMLDLLLRILCRLQKPKKNIMSLTSLLSTERRQLKVQ